MLDHSSAGGMNTPVNFGVNAVLLACRGFEDSVEGRFSDIALPICVYFPYRCERVERKG